jgi:hypothetical protein
MASAKTVAMARLIKLIKARRRWKGRFMSMTPDGMLLGVSFIGRLCIVYTADRRTQLPLSMESGGRTMRSRDLPHRDALPCCALLRPKTLSGCAKFGVALQHSSSSRISLCSIRATLLAACLASRAPLSD